MATWLLFVHSPVDSGWYTDDGSLNDKPRPLLTPELRDKRRARIDSLRANGSATPITDADALVGVETRPKLLRAFVCGAAASIISLRDEQTGPMDVAFILVSVSSNESVAMSLMLASCVCGLLRYKAIFE